MTLAVLPLAITMVTGPQILTSFVLVTNKNGPVRVSVSYLLAIVLATSVGVAAFFTAARFFHLHADTSGHESHLAQAVQLVLVAILIWLAIHSYLHRRTAKAPKWLVGLETVKPPAAFSLGLLLIWLMPGDILVMSVVGVHIAALGVHPSDITKALPFIGLTLLLAALPLVGYLALGRRATRIMPKLRGWMEHNSWLINIIVYLFFIALLVHAL